MNLFNNFFSSMSVSTIIHEAGAGVLTKNSDALHFVYKQKKHAKHKTL